MGERPRSVDEEKAWQNERLRLLPPELAELVSETLVTKEKGIRI
jgi:hypothetical protein